MKWSRRSRKNREIAAAERRWQARNDAARAEGCKCGKPGTVVRRYGGNIGSVPVEFWSCAEHADVTSWWKSGDGPWIPAGGIQPMDLSEQYRVD